MIAHWKHPISLIGWGILLTWICRSAKPSAVQVTSSFPLHGDYM